MATAAFVKYNSFIDEISKGGHNLQTPPTLKLALTNTAPNAASDTVWNTTVAPAPAAAAGYTAGGNTLTGVTGTTTAGVFKLVVADSVFTASGGSIGPFRYAILYNTTASSKLLGYYDYASSITLADTETFTFDADPTNGILTIT
jgi:hypothetical protein